MIHNYTEKKKASGERLIRILGIVLITLLGVLFLSASSFALSVNPNPSFASRNVNGKVRMHIELKGAVKLLSCGVELDFDPTLLQVVEGTATTFKDGSVWVMEGDSASYTDPEIEVDNSNGKVTMIGGRLTGFTGDTLIGVVTFSCIAEGTATVNLKLAHPEPYDNFVDTDKTVHDSSVTLGSGVICIVDPSGGDAEACESDFNGDGMVNPLDYSQFKKSFNKVYPNSDYNPAEDFNADGMVNPLDYSIFKVDFNRKDCPCKK